MSVQNERIDQLVELTRLSEREAQVFVLNTEMMQPMGDIANALDVSRPVVYKYRERARQKIEDSIVMLLLMNENDELDKIQERARRRLNT